MDCYLTVKSFSGLENNEKEQLSELVNPGGIFPLFLNDRRGYRWRFASLAKIGEGIIGWAAVDIGKNSLNAVGAYTKSGYRGRGVARACLDQVLDHAQMRLNQGDRCYLMYDKGYKGLFYPAIKNNGFLPSSATLRVCLG